MSDAPGVFETPSEGVVVREGFAGVADEHGESEGGAENVAVTVIAADADAAQDAEADATRDFAAERVAKVLDDTEIVCETVDVTLGLGEWLLVPCADAVAEPQDERLGVSDCISERVESAVGVDDACEVDETDRECEALGVAVGVNDQPGVDDGGLDVELLRDVVGEELAECRVDLVTAADEVPRRGVGVDVPVNDGEGEVEAL